MCARCPEGSTNQAYPSGFYHRIVWILMEQPCFFSKLFLRISAGPQKLQKLSLKSLDQTFKFLIKKGYFGALIFQELKFLTTIKLYVRVKMDHAKKGKKI